MVLEALSFDVFDLTQGILQGTARPPEGRLVWVGIGWENDPWSMDAFTDLDGDWLADYGMPVPYGYQWVAAQDFDPDGDASEVRPLLIADMYTLSEIVAEGRSGAIVAHCEAKDVGRP